MTIATTMIGTAKRAVSVASGDTRTATRTMATSRGCRRRARTAGGASAMLVAVIVAFGPVGGARTAASTVDRPRPTANGASPSDAWGSILEPELIAAAPPPVRPSITRGDAPGAGGMAGGDADAGAGEEEPPSVFTPGPGQEYELAFFIAAAVLTVLVAGGFVLVIILHGRGSAASDREARPEDIEA